MDNGFTVNIAQLEEGLVMSSNELTTLIKSPTDLVFAADYDTNSFLAKVLSYKKTELEADKHDEIQDLEKPFWKLFVSTTYRELMTDGARFSPEVFFLYLFCSSGFGTIMNYIAWRISRFFHVTYPTLLAWLMWWVVMYVSLPTYLTINAIRKAKRVRAEIDQKLAQQKKDLQSDFRFLISSVMDYCNHELVVYRGRHTQLCAAAKTALVEPRVKMNQQLQDAVKDLAELDQIKDSELPNKEEFRDAIKNRIASLEQRINNSLPLEQELSDKLKAIEVYLGKLQKDVDSLYNLGNAHSSRIEMQMKYAKYKTEDPNELNVILENVRIRELQNINIAVNELGNDVFRTQNAIHDVTLLLPS